jgi:DNA-binding beta-propeller fold protein YncE
MSSTISLSILCGRVHPVGFSSNLSVAGFPPGVKLGIDLLDLDQKRLQLFSSGTVTTDGSGAVAAFPLQINVPDGLYFVRVFVDDGTGNPASGQPESQVQIAAPCDVLYAMTQFTGSGLTPGAPKLHNVEIVDVTVRSAPHLLRLVLIPLDVVMSLDVSPDRRRFYVFGGTAGAATATLGAYDATSGTLIASLPVSGSNRVVALSPDGEALFLAAGPALTSVFTPTMTLRAPSFNEPTGTAIDALVFSPDGKTLVATAGAMVHLLNPVSLTVTKSIPVVMPTGGRPQHMTAAFTDANLLLLWDHDFSQIHQIDLTAQAQIIAATIVIEVQILGDLIPLLQIVYSPLTQNAYALRRTLDLITASPASRTLVELTDFVGSPGHMAMTPDGAHIYLVKQPSDTPAPTTLDVFDTRTNSLTERSIFEFKHAAPLQIPMIIRSSPKV